MTRPNPGRFQGTVRGALVLALLVGACGRGGGSGGANSNASVTLVSLRFPDPSGQSGGDPERPPQNASLIQQVIFGFSGVPDANTVHARSLRILDPEGVPVPGRYEVIGRDAIFTPALPLRAFEIQNGTTLDNGGAGLDPGVRYDVEVLVGRADSVANLVALSADLHQRFPHPTQAQGLSASFLTATDPLLFLTGLEVTALQRVDLSPPDGFANLSPFLLSDPEQLFDPPQVIELVLDGPLFPSGVHLNDQNYRLVDLDDTRLSPAGLPLGTHVELVENSLHRARLRLRPSGILPLGHLLAVEVPEQPWHVAAPAQTSTNAAVAAVYTVADSPRDPLADAIVERFEATDGFDAETSVGTPGIAAAEWSRLGNATLQASAAITGGGELGPFLPAVAPTARTLLLDTNRQPLPLLDGSTPRARPGTVVLGGVFNFTDIDIPANVTVLPLGSNPLVLTATGSIRVAGTIDVRAKDGTSDTSFDSAIFPIPGGRGGAGGGRGGASHPTLYFPPLQFGLLNLTSPPAGENGFGAPRSTLQGGRGGLTLILDVPEDPNPEISCSEANNNHSNDGGRGAHAGGGSFLSEGRFGRVGWGNMQPQSDRTWVDLGVTFPRGGRPGPLPFRDARSDNDFIGPAGEVPVLMGGQGGGGGGSKAEGYYCGSQFPWGKNESNGAFPDTGSDSRGGGGGGAGGALELRALGPVVLESTAELLASGGNGGGGETTGRSNWGGGGGGGSGGAVVLKSGTSIDVLPGALVEVRGGGGNNTGIDACTTGCGGDGLVQLQVPLGSVARMQGTIQPATSWVDPLNERQPAEFGSVSMGVSRWIDLGRTIDRASDGSRPAFSFLGTDASGAVIRDANGFILQPEQQSFRVGYLGRVDEETGLFFPGEEPVADWIPTNAEVWIEFQGADAIAPGSKEVGSSGTAWSPDPGVAQGRQFVRFRVRFDVATDGSQITAATRKPAVLELRVDLEF